MLQYLVIVLDDASTSYCHYLTPSCDNKLISVDDLKEGVMYALKENLSIQFVYPSYRLPSIYEDIIDSVDNTKIKPWDACDISEKDIIVYDDLNRMLTTKLFPNGNYVLRLNWSSLINNSKQIAFLFGKVKRINIIITDFESIKYEDISKYGDFLNDIADYIKELYIKGETPQTNVLTDRLFLSRMNNCNAGDSSITLCPDGRFYPCPAFYQEKVTNPSMGLGGSCEAPFSIGNLQDGLTIRNKELYKLDHAPICSICDSYQCKRCIWLNKHFTREINTPSHEQCIISHLEREASLKFLKQIRQHGTFMPEQDIAEISYSDPFNLIYNSNE